ncbi:endonuclease/exonuclease/phosphatase family protein [Kitasatospora herbaricolor]|uniref:Endonuclease/exonuclease/phosphatase domain-containing protein n=1 Tax=Kitasatospora herbaricolor TaxID=68217 RepID=A0ABZ1W109_9ACTN|nr:endonuclease/exonuclease/phosphatase family protein [Kitasatospora herbaricolor]
MDSRSARLRAFAPRARYRLAGPVVAAAALLTFLLLGHRMLPNRAGHLGSLVETFLPWLGAAVPVLLLCGLAGRSPRAVLLVLVLVPATVWTAMFGGMLVGAGGGPATAGDLKVLQHNVSDENRDPAGTARALARAGPDLIALEELTPAALPAYAEPLRRVLLLGDLNSTLDDRGLRPVTSRLTAARTGFGFTWPAARPLARIDQVLSRGLRPLSATALPATGSDRLPLTARLGW